jgi:hypothetical protein
VVAVQVEQEHLMAQTLHLPILEALERRDYQTVLTEHQLNELAAVGVELALIQLALLAQVVMVEAELGTKQVLAMELLGHKTQAGVAVVAAQALVIPLLVETAEAES